MISRKFFVYDEKHTCKRTRKSKHLSQISKLILALSAFRRQWANGTANYIILITKSNLKLILAPSALRIRHPTRLQPCEKLLAGSIAGTGPSDDKWHPLPCPRATARGVDRGCQWCTMALRTHKGPHADATRRGSTPTHLLV